ncbi:class I SAM-dependent methyltransferase [Streptomyces sp. NPDC000345]|uniref:class I SAM-dependent methyltransferase n=1 Tax=Streptomyces sp. NPDC000345 TaxID=3364537 RepID=UPI0036962AE6
MTSLHDFYDPDLYDRKVGLSPRVEELYTAALAPVSLPATVMELGCGTGDVLRPLVRKGFRVIGVDRSAAMLQRCRQHLESEGLQPQADLVEMTLPALPDTTAVDAIIAPNDCISHLLTNDLVLELFRNARRVLSEKNGVLMLDVSRFNVAYLGKLAGPDGDLTRTHGIYELTDDQYLRVGEQSRYRPDDGVLTCSFRYELLSGSGEVESVWYRTLRMYPRRAQEITMLLELAGFSVVRVQTTGLPAGMDSVFVEAALR